MKKLIAALCISVGLLMLLCMGAYASTSGSLTGEEYMSYIKGLTGMEYQPPYVTSQAGDETISTSSGSLMLTATDLFIPGKNGHDVVVKRRYISQDSDFNYISDIISDRKNASLYRINYQGYRYTTQPNGQGTEYFILFYNEQHMYLYGKDTIYANPQFTQTAKR